MRTPMSITRTASVWRWNEHFEPDDSADPQAQRRLRASLEQIDYTAYASNKEVIGQMIGSTDAKAFQRLAVAAAQARAGWVKAALAVSEQAEPLGVRQIEAVAHLRTAYEELAEAYDAMRRLVERGYLTYAGA